MKFDNEKFMCGYCGSLHNTQEGLDAHSCDEMERVEAEHDANTLINEIADSLKIYCEKDVHAGLNHEVLAKYLIKLGIDQAEY